MFSVQWNPEESCFYRLLIDEVRPENYTLLGLKKNQTIIDEDKKKITEKLTEKRKAVIMRDLLVKKVVTYATATSPESDMLVSLIGEHFPEDLEEIEEEVAASYDSKEKKLDEEAAKLQKELEEPKVPLVAEATEESHNTTGNEILLLPEAQLDGQESVSLEQVRESGQEDTGTETASISESIIQHFGHSEGILRCSMLVSIRGTGIGLKNRWYR